MKYIRILLVSLFVLPFAARAASSEFMVAAQLLSAAKNADIQQVQALINNGANVNFVDSTGMSIVCTALMNNDVRAAQILQMYGADASNCDRQIKQYRNKNTTKTGSGGLFGGLSSAQSMTLAAAGAAVVVGGLLLLTDVFDPGNDNESPSSGGNRGDKPGGNTGGSATGAGEIPVGPAYLTPDGKIDYTTDKYKANLALWNPSAGGVFEWDFNYFRPDVQKTNNYLTDGITVPMQNYLLMMHGYSSFANGYMGQKIFRDSANKNNPQKVAYEDKPVLVSLITENGINPTGSADRGDGIVYGLTAATNAQTARTDKYLNYSNPTSENSTVVLGAEQKGFDLSGSGTAMNPFASANQNALAKIIGGWDGSARSTGDLFGFVPNGQLGIFRTGGGYTWTDVTDPTSGAVQGTVVKGTGTSTSAMEIGDTITINGKSYKLSLALDGTSVTSPTITVNGTTYKLATDSKVIRGVCTATNLADCDGVSDIAIYIGTDGYYYVNTTGGNRPDAVYVVNNNNLYTQKTQQATDINNYTAMFAARAAGGAAIANAVLNPKSRAVSYLDLGGLETAFKLNSGADKKTVFAGFINKYYGADTSSTAQGVAANIMFGMYNNALPIIVNPAGEFEFGAGDGKSLTVLDATFENYAPLLYGNNLQHMFMTVVAVGHATGTSSADSIENYGNGTGSSYGPLYLSMWTDTRGTPETSDDVMYQSRKCGIAGSGTGGNGIDPWCFAAAGPTTEMATAAAAGAVAAVQGAFKDMSKEQVFMLLALTADGAYLGSNDNGTSLTKDNLVAYLRAMYSLPPEYDNKIATSDEYLNAFKDVYGYGLINLERALTPKKQLYYYNGGKIVGANGNAYWRAATNATTFRASSAFSPRMATISAPFFDKLESVDGEMALPRIWKNEFAVGAQSRRGLYMGDVLGEFRVDNRATPRTQIGNIGFSMTTSSRAYNDNMGGLDTLHMDYARGAWNFAAGYQHHLTDGASRFDGMSNPILGLASNAVTTDVNYHSGKWSFGARAFSGTITSEDLLENDPTISSQYEPARLGLISGAQSHIAWHGNKFGFTTAFGNAHESDTLLGAQTDGLLNLGTGDTMYIDSELSYRPVDDITLRVRGTFARTTSDMTGGDFILGMSDIYSDAIAAGVDVGNFNFTVSRPLGVNRGVMQYSHADYDIIEVADGKYDIAITNAGVRDVDLTPENREVRFTATYRRALGAFTDGAIGFIYRVNPNHTDEFGDESIFMLKLKHRLGI